MEPKNILIRMPNWVGDLVMATPILTDLRRAFPSAHITAMGCIPTCELLKEDPDIDELFCFHKVKWFSRHSLRRDVIEKIKNGKYDLGVLLPNSFSSAWLLWQGRVKRRLGYACNGRSLILTDAPPLPKEISRQHLVLTYKMLLKSLAIPVSATPPRIYLATKEIEAAREWLSRLGVSEKDRIIGINPGAHYGSAKCWLPERFKEVTQRLLQEKGITIVYFGDSVTAPLIKGICRDLPPQEKRVINLAGLTSLRELAALIKQCHLLLTNDSGPMHLAAALGTPLVALFGSTNEIVTGPYQGGMVINKHVSCAPCYRKICPIDFRCMKQIGVVEVVDTILNALKP